MKVMLKDLGTLQVGYQAREAVRGVIEGTHWIVQMRNLLSHGRIDRQSLIRFNPDRDPEPYIVRDDDVLLQVRGTTHRAGLVRGLKKPALAANHFYRLRLNTDRVLPAYLVWYINQPAAQSHILKGAQSAGTVSVVPRAVFESLEIPAPPRKVQEHILELDRLQRREEELTAELQERRAQWLSLLCMRLADDNQPTKRKNST